MPIVVSVCTKYKSIQGFRCAITVRKMNGREKGDAIVYGQLCVKFNQKPVWSLHTNSPEPNTRDGIKEIAAQHRVNLLIQDGVCWRGFFIHGKLQQPANGPKTSPSLPRSLLPKQLWRSLISCGENFSVLN